MQAGKLREVLEIQTNTPTANAYGEMVPAWATVATVRGQVQILSGREFIEAKQREVDLSAKITIRYRADITANQRVKWGARYFDIDAVLDAGGAARALILMVRELK